MRRYLPLLLVIFSIGCVVDNKTKDVPKPDNRDVIELSLEDATYKSLQERDTLRGDLLFALAKQIRSGEVKYDGKVLEEIKKTGVISSDKTKHYIEPYLQKLDEGSYDANKIADAIESMARGSRKAGGG